MKKLLIASALSFTTLTASAMIDVTADNYPVIETNRQMTVTQDKADGINKFQHRRQLAPTAEQTVVRLNRDTYYSFATVDVSKGATVTLPELPAGQEDYYITSMVVTEDHRIQEMVYGPGERTITTHEGDHVVVVIRLDARFTEDQARVLQDKMFVTANSDVAVAPLEYNEQQFKAVEADLKGQLPALFKRDGINTLTGMFTDPRDESGKNFDKEKYLVGSAIGWGGAQAVDNTYEVSGNMPSDTCHQATFEDPKNHAFWSVTVYNEAGFMFNDVANVNSDLAVQNADGTFTVSFGCGADAPNNIETDNDSGVFNLGIRHYQPSDEVRSGKIRVLPTVKAIK